MVSWVGDGTITGYNPVTKARDPNLYKLASPGFVDLNGITRMGWSIDTSLASDYPYAITAAASITITQSDLNALTSGTGIGIALYVAKASDLPTNPKPSDVMALPDSKVHVELASKYSEEPGTFSMVIAEKAQHYLLDDDAKYWFLLVPVQVSPWIQAWSKSYLPPLANINVNTFCRGVSLWSNREPKAPTITSPANGASLSPGSIVPFLYNTNDPDSVIPPDDTYRLNRDLAAIEVQIAKVPTPDDPGIKWRTLGYDVAGEHGEAIYLRGMWWNWPTQAVQYSAMIDNLGFPLAIGTFADEYLPGHGRVTGSGDYYLRMRVGDFGTFYPSNGLDPLKPGIYGLDIRDYEDDGLRYFWPSTAPQDVSPWSPRIRISILAKVPPPELITPADNIAIEEGSTIRFEWLYKNTNIRRRRQAGRWIELREVVPGDSGPWTLVSATETRSQFWNMPPDWNPPPPDPAIDYNPDTGFENGTLSGWKVIDVFAYVDSSSTSAIPGIPATNVNDSAKSHSGNRHLSATLTSALASDYPLTAFFKRLTLDSARPILSVSGWVMPWVTTPSSVEYAAASLTIEFRDVDGNLLPKTDDDVARWGRKIPGSHTPDTWHKLEILDERVPAGAVVADVLFINTLGADSTTGLNYRIDDVSITAESPYAGASPFSFTAGKQYEWRARTEDEDGERSDWSDPEPFWIVPAPASGDIKPLPSSTIDGATLGCGTHRAFIYRRGGQERVGELTGLTHVDWSRVRDDISTAEVVVSDWGIDCGNLLAQLQTWAYELVIYRDNGYSNDRVWEGPITLITYENDRVVIDAKDVMAYPYRRIIKQRMSDAGKGNGTTVVNRAKRVLQNALGPDDPNVLAYLKVISNTNDAMQYRSVPAYSRTAFEEVDDMAANAGLDYTCSGRSILIWGTRNRIGTLPEFRDEDLGSSPIVSEYGMSMANYYAVSDGNGVWGAASKLRQGGDEVYGRVEMLSSTWASDTESETGTYTQEGRDKVIESFEEYSESSIADRYPPPVVVRVPDNTTLNPDAVISIQHLIPGVAIPLRSTGTLRHVRATQKLDSIKVVEESGAETVSITLSPFSRDDRSLEGEGEA